jgi:hypothetical protein
MRNHLAVALVLLSAVAARADVVLTAEAPGVQTSQVPGVSTENFDGFAIGQYQSLNTAVGKLSAISTIFGFRFDIKPADVYGGAGGSGRYFAVGVASGSDARLRLDAPQSYLGLWLSALNEQNRIQLYSSGSLVASFNAVTVDALLPFAYNFNPNKQFTFGSAPQPYVYLNFIATGGTTFDTIDFNNFPPSGMEMDNLSISSTPLSEPYPGTFMSGGVSVPDPSALAAAFPFIACFLASRRRPRL